MKTGFRRKTGRSRAVYESIQKIPTGKITEISLVLPLGIVRIDEKTARYGPFFAENQFSPADEFVLVGLVVRKCHFDVTACAEARRLEKHLTNNI